jgi:hypothetical protein
MSTISHWPFQDPQNVAVFTTKQVVKKRKPILFVTHDADDGAWQFHSGDMARDGDAMILALSEIVGIDPTVAELADLPLGYKASCISPSSPWKRHQA